MAGCTLNSRCWRAVRLSGGVSVSSGLGKGILNSAVCAERLPEGAPAWKEEAAARFGQSPLEGQQTRLWSSAAICAVSVKRQEDVSQTVSSCEQEEVRQKS